MEALALAAPELEAAGIAARGRDHEAAGPATRTALDVPQVVLELADATLELVAQLLEGPVASAQGVCDFLAPGGHGCC